MMKRLHKAMKHDKFSVKDSKKHKALEKRYAKLEAEFAKLKSRKNLKPHHVKRFHKKVHKLHKEAKKHQHSYLDQTITDFSVGIGNLYNKAKEAVKSGYSALQAKIAEDKYKASEEGKMKAKLEAERKTQAEADAKKAEEEKIKLMD